MGLYAAGWVKILTGVDYGDRWRGRYRSLDDIDALLKDEGFDTLGDYVGSIFPDVSPAMAQVGDLAIVEWRALGIVASDRVFVLRPDGLGHVSRMRAEGAFSV